MVYLCFCANVRKKKKILSYSSYLCAQRNNNWITWINLLLFGCFRRRKYLITFVLFVVLVGFLDENSIVRRLGYYREETRLRGEIDRYRAEYEENTRRLNELAVDSGAIEKIAREKYLMKKPNEDIYLFQEDIEE